MDPARPTVVSFPCPTCQQVGPGAATKLGWPRLLGFEDTCVRVLGPTNPAIRAMAASAPTKLADETWCELLPAVGSTCLAKVTHPFSATLGVPFWCLFRPSLSHQNGWPDHPEELVDSGLLRATICNVLARDPTMAMVEMEIEATIRLPDLALHFADAPVPVRTAPFDQGLRPDHVRVSHCCAPGLRFLDANFQGDAGVWWLFSDRGAAAGGLPTQLLLQGEWGDDYAWVHAGNRPLTPDESARLAAWLAK